MFKGIDFFSDTMTRPTLAMRKAIAEAEVGDEQEGEDPTTLKLEEKMASMLGHSAAMFFPTVTMANQIAIRLQCRPGEELLAADTAHIFTSEAGGPAVHAQVMTKRIATPTGVFSGADLRLSSSYGSGPHYPVTRMVSVENTANMAGGVAWPKEQLDSVTTAAQQLGLKSHMDGARLFNAAIAMNLTPKEVAGDFDTVTVCFSKGLGCPAGAILAFDKQDWPTVRRLKQLMGGALRQSGILASAALYALDNHVDRLEEDHAHARQLAKGLVGMKNIRVENPEPSTNMVFFHWTSPNVPLEKFLESCERHGVRFVAVGPNRVRAVTHLDLSSGDIDRAVGVVRDIVNQ